jgi:hypothetical protein
VVPPGRSSPGLSFTPLHPAAGDAKANDAQRARIREVKVGGQVNGSPFLDPLG